MATKPRPSGPARSGRPNDWASAKKISEFIFCSQERAQCRTRYAHSGVRRRPKGHRGQTRERNEGAAGGGRINARTGSSTGIKVRSKRENRRNHVGARSQSTTRLAKDGSRSIASARPAKKVNPSHIADTSHRAVFVRLASPPCDIRKTLASKQNATSSHSQIAWVSRTFFRRRPWRCRREKGEAFTEMMLANSLPRMQTISLNFF